MACQLKDEGAVTSPFIFEARRTQVELATLVIRQASVLKHWMRSTTGVGAMKSIAGAGVTCTAEAGGTYDTVGAGAMRSPTGAGVTYAAGASAACATSGMPSLFSSTPVKVIVGDAARLQEPRTGRELVMRNQLLALKTGLGPHS